ncbi:MAG: hypothetical protein ACOWWM_00990 [Desulfobacterales bacterium]
MESMPSRDITGHCEGECRNRVREGEMERQRAIQAEPYNEPSPNSPDHTRNRNDQPGVWGGRV